MARLFTSGFETGNLNDFSPNNLNGKTSVVTTKKNSGTYSARINLTATFEDNEKTLGANDAFLALYARVYINVITAPTSNGLNGFFYLTGDSNIYLYLDSTSKIRLYNGRTDTQIGSASSALTANTWHYIEIFGDVTNGSGSQTAKARLDGSEFASATNLTIDSSVNQSNRGFNILTFGPSQGIDVGASFDVYFDDFAVNDTTGASDNSWPGAISTGRNSSSNRGNASDRHAATSRSLASGRNSA